jgi:hypothetical protein
VSDTLDAASRRLQPASARATEPARPRRGAAKVSQIGLKIQIPTELCRKRCVGRLEVASDEHDVRLFSAIHHIKFLSSSSAIDRITLGKESE